MTNPDTLRIYDERAADYADMTGVEDPLLRLFIRDLPDSGRVLDLGCGPGHHAAAMASTGLQVDAVDGSAEMVAIADAQPGVSARQAQFDAIENVDHYDGIWANFSLLHAPRADLPAHLARLHRALKPGGVFYIGMKLGEGEGPDTIGRFYVYYTQEELEQHMQDAGFTPTERHFGRDKGLDGTEHDWIVVAARA